MKESNLVDFDFEADYLAHIENLRDEILITSHRSPDLSYDDLEELIQLLDTGDLD